MYRYILFEGHILNFFFKNISILEINISSYHSKIIVLREDISLLVLLKLYLQKKQYIFLKPKSVRMAKKLTIMYLNIYNSRYLW